MLQRLKKFKHLQGEFHLEISVISGHCYGKRVDHFLNGFFSEDLTFGFGWLTVWLAPSKGQKGKIRQGAQRRFFKI